jgi:hypothetical protein
MPITTWRPTTQGPSSTAPPEGTCDFLVQTYARDTGALVTVLTVPLYVMGQRYGAGLLGWTEG